MLFFTRACLCIGTIVVLAEGLGPADVVSRSREAAGAAAGSIPGPLSVLCRAHPDDCVGVATNAVGMVAGTAFARSGLSGRGHSGRLLERRGSASARLSLPQPLPK